MHNTVANTILAQLGSRRFIGMTGARDFVAHEFGLSFSVSGRSTKNGINRIRIILMPDDTYEMQFIKYSNMLENRVDTVTGVYCDMLEDVFENKTGMYTSLVPRR